MSNFLKIYEGTNYKPRSNDPANPTDGLVQFSDGTHRAKGLWQYIDGNWIRVGSGEGGGLDVFYTETFELTDVGDFVRGNDPTPMLAGTFQGTLDYDSVTPIKGDNSLRYTQVAGSLDDWFASPEIELARKQSEGGKSVQFDFRLRSTHDQGDLRLFFVDADTDNVLNEYDILDVAQLDNQQFSVAVYIPDGVTSIRWGWQVLVENIGATLTIDEVQFKDNLFLTGEFDRTATIDATGSGDFTAGTFIVSRIGNHIILEILDAITHASASNPQSALGLLPTWARPNASTVQVYHASPLAPPTIFTIGAEANGRITFLYLDETLSTQLRVNSGSRGTITYIAADDSNISQLLSSSTLTPPSIYNLTTNQTAATAVQTRINYNASDTDLDGLVTTGAGWVWIAPRDGSIQVFAAAGVVGASDTIGNIYSIRVNKNGVENIFLGRERVTDTTIYSKVAQGSAYLSVTRGDEIYFEFTHNMGANRTIQNGNCSINYIDKQFVGAFPMASEAGAGLVPYYNEATIDLTGSGDFTAGSFKITRSGAQVIASGISDTTHASLSTASSAVGIVPAWARPTDQQKNNLYIIQGGVIYLVIISTTGQVIFQYFNATFASTNAVGSGANWSLTYNV